MGPYSKSFWSPEEWSHAQKCFAAGMSMQETADQIGKTYKQLSGKVVWHNMTEAQRVARCVRINAHRNASGEYKSTPRPDKPSIRLRASARQVADRDKRYTIQPRDLTAEFFGDPLPGYSALDRKQLSAGT